MHDYVMVKGNDTYPFRSRHSKAELYQLMKQYALCWYKKLSNQESVFDLFFADTKLWIHYADITPYEDAYTNDGSLVSPKIYTLKEWFELYMAK